MRCPKLADPLSRLERAGLILLALVPAVFGILVEVRGAFLQTRRTDLAVFARAAWAVRRGVDVYAVTDEKGLHYHYPPLLAILMAPLADPPPGVPMVATVPFAITVGAWYLLSVFVAFQSIHTLASALVESSIPLATAIGPRWSRGWWGLRVVPLLICLPYLGHALVIGQVNVLWMALTCWFAAALVRGHRFKAGIWLASAISIKVIPAFILLYPIWRRDRRCLAGAIFGLVLGLVVVPVGVLGSDGAWRTAQRWADVLLMPVLGSGSDLSREQELLGIWSTHNQAFAPIIFKTIHVFSSPRPDRMAPIVQITGICAGLLLTGLTLFAAGSQPPAS
ncbi:MAG TPA: glycosyltransferase family 87 protein, partial [Gemmataceae bacterium]|nr:glycosyltransferase family 87 protein [Gemmataceae bacterium]